MTAQAFGLLLHRALLLCALGSLTFAAPTVDASQGSMCATAFCQVMRPGYYRAQVPANWQRASTADDPDADAVFRSPDGQATLTLRVVPGSSPGDFLQGWAQGLAESGTVREVQVGFRGGAVPVVVPNAGTALYATAAFSDSDGRPYVDAVLAATRGSDVTVVELVSTAAYAEANPGQMDRLVRSLSIIP